MAHHAATSVGFLSQFGLFWSAIFYGISPVIFRFVWTVLGLLFSFFVFLYYKYAHWVQAMFPGVGGTSCVWIANCASVLLPVVVKLTVPDANITSLPQFLLLLLNLGAVSLCDSCIPSGPNALPVASLSRQAGAALLILFYLRAPLNINVFLSLNYSLTGLPTHSAFVYLPLFHSSTFPSCICLHYTWRSLSTPKVNFWRYPMWWVVGSHSSLSWFYDSNPATWAKSPPLLWPGGWHFWKHLHSQRRAVESEPEI